MTSSTTAMKQAIVFDSPYLPWIGAVVLGIGFLYYYFTRTDIPFIKGIPEIPGALPMYTPGHDIVNSSFGHLLQLGEVIILFSWYTNCRIMLPCAKSGLDNTNGRSFR